MSAYGTAVLKLSETMFLSRHQNMVCSHCSLKYEDKTLIVQVPSQFFYEFLEDKFVDLLRKTLYKVIGDGTKLMYNVLVDKSSGATVNQESTTRSTAIPQSGLPRVDERKAPACCVHRPFRILIPI